jgi:iron-regulated transporter 1
LVEALQHWTQNGLNSAMNTIKFVLVIILPEAETFGWLVITSFAFICFGAVSFAVYAAKNRSKTPENNLGYQDSDAM